MHTLIINSPPTLQHVTWGLAPIERYVSPQETYSAVCIGILLFNVGAQADQKLFEDLEQLLTLCDNHVDALVEEIKDKVGT